MSILHYMGLGLDPQTLAVGQCTIRRDRTNACWRLWLCVPDASNGGKPVTRQVPIRPNGDADPSGPGFGFWGLKNVGPGTKEWQVSPSIHMFNEVPADNPGDPPRRIDVWHETPKLVNVPDGEQWMSPVPDGGRSIRYIKEIGTRVVLRVYWDRMRRVDAPRHQEYLDTCANAWGRGKRGSHNVKKTVERRVDVYTRNFERKVEEYPRSEWPESCYDCGMVIPYDALLAGEPTALGQEGVWGGMQVNEERLYNTPSGGPEVGDAWWFQAHAPGVTDSSYHCPWTNCDGRHLYIKLPDQWEWNVMGRASNCSRCDDTTHRCWVISGDVERGTLTIGKGGDTCTAGAGSIDTGAYHGVVTNGVLAP